MSDVWTDGYTDPDTGVVYDADGNVLHDPNDGSPGYTDDYDDDDDGIPDLLDDVVGGRNDGSPLVTTNDPKKKSFGEWLKELNESVTKGIKSTAIGAALGGTAGTIIGASAAAYLLAVVTGVAPSPWEISQAAKKGR